MQKLAIIYFSFGILFFVAFPIVLSSAQEMEKKEDFFSKDFATSGGLTETEREDKEGIYGETHHKPQKPEIKKPISNPDHQPIPGIKHRPTSVDRLTLILNAENLENYKGFSENIIKLKDKIKTVVLVGNPGNDTDVVEELEQNGIPTQRRAAAPLGLKYSPSWIVESNGQAIILDGVKDPISQLGSPVNSDKESKNENFDVSGF